MTCLPDYTVTLSPSLFAEPTIGLPTGPFEVEQYQKVANGTYGEATVYLCNYNGDLKLLLDQHIQIENKSPSTRADGQDNQGEICYCGYIEEVYRCCGDYVAWGWSAATLYNRIAVSWSENGTTQLTPWQENHSSIITHGPRELVLPLPAGSLYTPEQYATRLLQELGTPRPVLHNTYKCRCNLTTLKLRGYLNTLSWQSYSHPCGLADTGAGFAHLQALGVGFTSNLMGANVNVNGGVSQIGVIGDQLLAFEVGDTILMSGWGQAQNNLSTTITQFIKDDFESVTSTGINTRAPNAINDLNNGLIEFHPYEFIQVTGSDFSALGGGFDDYYWVRTENDGPQITIMHQSLPNADYYDVPVTITQGITIEVPEILAPESPGAAVTIQSYHQYLCQPICNTCTTSNGEPAEPWTATRVQIAVSKVGNPTGAIALALGPDCTTALQPPIGGQGVATATISAASVTATMRYIEAELDTPITLAPGACLYVQIHPTGALSTTDYYQIGGSLAQNPADRALTGPDGLAWTATAYTTAVRLLEYQSITEQLFDLVSLGNIITSVSVLDQLAFAVPTYRTGYTSLLYVIEQLLTMGDPAGQRLQLLLDCEGQAVIRNEPAQGDESPITLDCCSCTDKAICDLAAGCWLRPQAGIPENGLAVFLDSVYVSYKQCRARFIDRDSGAPGARTQFAQSLRYPGLF